MTMNNPKNHQSGLLAFFQGIETLRRHIGHLTPCELETLS